MAPLICRSKMPGGTKGLPNLLKDVVRIMLKTKGKKAFHFSLIGELLNQEIDLLFKDI